MLQAPAEGARPPGNSPPDLCWGTDAVESWRRQRTYRVERKDWQISRITKDFEIKERKGLLIIIPKEQNQRPWENHAKDLSRHFLTEALRKPLM